MADTKISALSANAGLVGTDLVAVVDDPGGTPATQKATISQIKDYIIGLANTWASGQVFVAPVLGTPASGTLTNCTIPVGGVSGLGTGVGTFLETPTVANFNTALSDGDIATTGANTFTRLQTITQGTANEGVIASTGYSLTGSNAQSLIDLTGTWNTTGTPTALKLNVTDTASNASSLLLDLRVGGSSKFSITKAGSITIGSGISSVGTITMVGGAYLDWSSRGSINLPSTGVFNFNNAAGTSYFFIAADAADIFAQRNSTNAQTFRVYETYTDSSNYERASLSCASNTATLAAETGGTGSDDMDVALTPAGAGLVKYGTHSAIGAEAVTGFITIKDAGGTNRKLAVVS